MSQSVVVIGNFDGVHRGHQSLLVNAAERAEELSVGQDAPLRVIAVTFWPHPTKIFAPERAPKLLGTLGERIELLKRHGADEVRVVQFNRAVAAWSPTRFVEAVISPLNPALVIVGRNFTFGSKAAGTPYTLAELGRGRFEVDSMPLFYLDGEQTSSSLIRHAVDIGDVEAAAHHLGRPYRLVSTVVMGDQRGRELGFPTANNGVDPDLATPADGVYAGWLTRLDAAERTPMPAAISVGSNPTFDGVERRVESYVLDRTDLELYGVNVAVDFVGRLRGQVRFKGLDELISQMSQDVAQTRVILGI